MSFESIRGQDRAVRVLKRALAAGTLPHAYLFYGPEGVGRFTTALRLAEAVLCPHAAPEGCGACPDCGRTLRECHPDLSVVRPLSRKGEREGDPERGAAVRIDQVRELQRWLGARSLTGDWRVAILDGAEKINTEAANALLKTLEEPPARSLVVLVGTSRSGLMPTIVSRCQAVYFAPLSREVLQSLLPGTYAETDRETRDLVASMASGSLGRALRMDTAWVVGERKEWIERLCAFVDGRGGGSLVSFAEDLAGAERLPEILDLYLGWYRDLLHLSARGDEDRIANADFSGLLRDVADRGCAQMWIERIEAIWSVRRDLRDARVPYNSRFILEDLLLTLSRGEARG